MARILITGATGSLGRRVAARAVADGHTVLGTHVRPLEQAQIGPHAGPGAVGTQGRAPEDAQAEPLAESGVRGGPGLHGMPVAHAAPVEAALGTGGRGLRDPLAGVAWTRLDIRDRDAVRAVVDMFRPDIVVHTAAGRDRNDWAPTADGAANVALACVGYSEMIARTIRDAEPGAGAAPGSSSIAGDGGVMQVSGVTGRVRLVHVSSDAIFSGRAGREYTEGDEPDPIYPYGAAKAAAETAVRAIDPLAAIVRTSLILGDGNGAHERLTHDLVAGRVDGALFVDEVRKPVHVDDLADALLEIGAGEYSGVVNVAGSDAVSRYELGLLVARRDGLDAGRIRSATSSGRPGDIRLDIGLAVKVLHTRLRGAHEFMSGA